MFLGKLLWRKWYLYDLFSDQEWIHARNFEINIDFCMFVPIIL